MSKNGEVGWLYDMVETPKGLVEDDGLQRGKPDGMFTFYNQVQLVVG